jgi:predicted anti-sigma-YlaC factor YlaD
MKTCPDFELLQDYLDGELVAEQVRAVEEHLAGCADCAREVASYRLVFERLENLPLWEPSPALVDRVLAEAMPAHPARWLRYAGWAYAASLVASLGAITVAATNVTARAWMATLAADAAKSVVRSFLFVLQSVNEGLLHTVNALGSRGEWVRSLPLLHAVIKPLSQPVVLFTLWAAVVAGVALLWWMRPREGRSVRGSRHVGVLGF